VVAKSVFQVVGPVGMGGPVQAFHLRVIARALVAVAHFQGQWGPGCSASEHARKDLHAIGFLALGGELVLAWPSAIQLGLNFLQVYHQSGGEPIDDASYRDAVAFSVGADSQNAPENISHGGRQR
jgi:hypothetical protein